MTTNGNPASSAAVYDDPEVLEVFPMAPTILDSLEAAANRPQTPYYSEVSGAIQREYHPPSSVTPETGERAQALIEAVLSGDQRSEEHTSELQSRQYLVCRLLLEK